MRLQGNVKLYAWTIALLVAGSLIYSNLYRLSQVPMFAGTFIQRLGCYPIYDSALLTMPGCYVLQNDIAVQGSNSYGLYVKAPKVSIDLNGKTLSGPSASSLQAGIYIEGGDDISISGGYIQGFMFGVRGEADRFGKPLKSVSLEKMQITDTQLIGFKFVAEQVTVLDTRVVTADPAMHSDGRGLFGAMLETSRCLLRRVAFQTHPTAGTGIPPSVIPADCKLENTTVN